MQRLVFCCAVALIAGAHAVGAQRPLSLVDADWGRANGGLRMAISSVTPATDRAHGPDFYISIENIDDRGVVLNMGFMISNGKVMSPKTVRLLLTDSQGTTRELRYVDRRYAGIAGRVDDFIVTLRAGSVYAIRVSLDHYRSSATGEFGHKLARTVLDRSTFRRLRCAIPEWRHAGYRAL